LVGLDWVRFYEGSSPRIAVAVQVGFFFDPIFLCGRSWISGQEMVTGMHGGLGFGLDGQRGGGSIGLKKSKEAEEQEGDMRVVSSIWREWRYVTGVGWAKSGDVKGRGTNSGVLPASFWNYHYPRPIGTHKKVVSLWYVVNIVVAMAFTWWLLVRFWVVVSMGSFGGGGNTGCQGVRAQNANGASAGDFDFSVGKGVEVWNQTEWSLSTKMYIPGQFQSRLSLANGYVYLPFSIPPLCSLSPFSSIVFFSELV